VGTPVYYAPVCGAFKCHPLKLQQSEQVFVLNFCIFPRYFCINTLLT
jgi:hypothetical protein